MRYPRVVLVSHTLPWQSHELHDARRCHAFVCDISRDAIPLPAGSIDTVMLVFTLSALRPERMEACVRALARVLRPGGVLLVRDYGRFDLCQVRMKGGRLLQDSFYIRGDGTRVYFFTQGALLAPHQSRVLLVLSALAFLLQRICTP